jgi:hypothetical protein
VNGNEPGQLTGACAKHWSERAVGRCDDCGEMWCTDCLVPPTRKRRPLRCVECALVAAGVRARGPRHAPMLNMSRAQRRPTSRW